MSSKKLPKKVYIEHKYRANGHKSKENVKSSNTRMILLM